MQKIVRSSFRWVGLCVGIMSLAYFLNSALEQIPYFPPVQWSMGACITLTSATLINCLVVILGGYAWILLLRGCGEPIRTVEALIIFILSQFAKYIPGNVAHHAGRITLACGRGITLSRVVFSMVIEHVLIVVTALIMTMVYLVFFNNTLLEYSQKISVSFQIIPAATLVIVFSFIAGWIILRWYPGPVRRLFNPSIVRLPSLKSLTYGFLIYTLSFIFIGVVSDILVRGLFAVRESRIGLLTIAYAIAWIAGLLAPGAPAGLGVREAILLKILGPIYGTAMAVELAITLRVVNLLADGITFMLAFIARQKVAFFHKTFGNGKQDIP